jgi:hypothetical protein
LCWGGMLSSLWVLLGLSFLFIAAVGLSTLSSRGHVLF